MKYSFPLWQYLEVAVASFLSFCSPRLNKPTAPINPWVLSHKSSAQIRPANKKIPPIILSLIHTQLSSKCFLMSVYLRHLIPGVKCIPKTGLASYLRAWLFCRCFPFHPCHTQLLPFCGPGVKIRYYVCIQFVQGFLNVICLLETKAIYRECPVQ